MIFPQDTWWKKSRRSIVAIANPSYLLRPGSIAEKELTAHPGMNHFLKDHSTSRHAAIKQSCRHFMRDPGSAGFIGGKLEATASVDRKTSLPLPGVSRRWKLSDSSI